MTFKFFYKPFALIPVSPITTGIIIHFFFHILYISIHKLLHFSFFPASFCTTFLSVGIATSISMYIIIIIIIVIVIYFTHGNGRLTKNIFVSEVY